MRRFLIALGLSVALPAAADTLSAEIAHDGLASVQARLTALPAPSPDDIFALGGVQFLRAVEVTLQDRWHQGLGASFTTIPFLRLPLADNPNPDAFDPASVVGVFIHAGNQLTLAKATLTQLPDSAAVDVAINLDDLWFDVNSNTTRDPGEGLGDIIGTDMLGGDNPAQALPTVHFDVADAAWLAAYADVLNAFCDMARAYDPTEPLIRITRAHDAMAALGPMAADPIFDSGAYDPAQLGSLDLVAVILATLNQQPDAARMASARRHLLAMIAENRQFWARVAMETDDNHEWLPSDSQHSALGIALPPGTGPAWLAILADLEQVLNGQKLLPFWRAGPPAGLNMQKFFQNPAPIDVAGWVQGWAALPYLEKGLLADGASTDAFDLMTQGQTMLFALYLN